MNIVNKLTLRHLKENKGRTVVTSMGIIVSVAMITAVFVAISSFMNLFGDVAMITSGSYHTVIDVQENQVEKLKNDDRIKKLGLSKKTDYDSFYIDSSKSRSNRVGEFYVGDSNELSMLVTQKYDGVLPKNENEIAVEENFLKKNNLDWKIGDTVTFAYGQRVSTIEGEDAFVTGMYLQGEETFKPKGTKTAKVTAILHKNLPTFSQYKIIFGYDSSHIHLEKGEMLDGSIILSELNYNSLNVVKDIAKEYHDDNYLVNRDLLESYYAFDEDGTFYNVLLPMGIFVLAIILVASIVLIYNAFAMSASERVRYLGMLSSVGATKTQKRRSIYFEGLVLGAVSIPFGILSGFVGIGITLNAIGNKIISTNMIAGLEKSTLKMKVSIDPIILVGIVIISVLTIFVSSLIPALKASRVTPIEALRQSQEIKLKAKKLRTSKLIRKIFGYEGEIAAKNLKRNGRKSRVITASIALSVILFLVCNFFTSMFSMSVDLESEMPYQVNISFRSDCSQEDRKDVLKKLDNMSNVDDYFSNVYNMFMGDSKNKNILSNEKHLNSSYKKSLERFSIYLNAVDDEDFNELCRKNGIDYKPYYTNDFRALLLNDIKHSSSIMDSKVFKDSIKGEKLTDCFEKDVVIGDLISYDKNNYICNLNPKSSVSMYVPLSVMEKNIECEYSLGVVTENHEQVTEELNDYIDNLDVNNGGIFVMDFTEQLQAMNTITFVLSVFVYGFIALISLITMFNIINTISTGVAMRRKEFAMFKSVGTTPKGFNKMIMLESALYGIKAVIFAVPLSVLLSYGMYLSVGDSSIDFKINWLLYLCTILVVFLLIGITMIYSVRKLKDDSIIETLKQDIT